MPGSGPFIDVRAEVCQKVCQALDDGVPCTEQMACDGSTTRISPLSARSAWRVLVGFLVAGQGVAFAYSAGGGQRGGPVADLLVLVASGALILLAIALMTTRSPWLWLAGGLVEGWVAIGGVYYLTHSYGSDGPIYFEDPATKGLRMIGYAHDPNNTLVNVLLIASAAIVLAYIAVRPRTGAISGSLAIGIGACLLLMAAVMAFAWYEQGQMLLDRFGGWTGIEGHADLGYGVDAPVVDLVVVDASSGTSTTVTTDRNGWIRLALPPGRYRLSVCPASSRAPAVEVLVPDRG